MRLRFSNFSPEAASLPKFMELRLAGINLFYFVGGSIFVFPIALWIIPDVTGSDPDYPKPAVVALLSMFCFDALPEIALLSSLSFLSASLRFSDFS